MHASQCKEDNSLCKIWSNKWYIWHVTIKIILLLYGGTLVLSKSQNPVHLFLKLFSSLSTQPEVWFAPSSLQAQQPTDALAPVASLNSGICSLQAKIWCLLISQLPTVIYTLESAMWPIPLAHPISGLRPLQINFSCNELLKKSGVLWGIKL